MAGSQPSINPWHEALGASCEGIILLAEGIAHHGFFLPDPAEKQNAEANDAANGDKPVLQQQRLRDRPKPERGVHGMAHIAVDALRHQRVLLAHDQAWGEIPSQLAMGAPEDPERNGEDGRTETGQPWSEGKV